MRYQFTVGGQLGAHLARSLGALDVEPVDHDTRLTFDVRDQAALLGLIDRVGDRGLSLLAIENLDLAGAGLSAGAHAQEEGSGVDADPGVRRG